MFHSTVTMVTSYTHTTNRYRNRQKWYKHTEMFHNTVTMVTSHTHIRLPSEWQNIHKWCRLRAEIRSQFTPYAFPFPLTQNTLMFADLWVPSLHCFWPFRSANIQGVGAKGKGWEDNWDHRLSIQGWIYNFYGQNSHRWRCKLKI